MIAPYRSVALVAACCALALRGAEPIPDQPFLQQVAQSYGLDHGLPSSDVLALDWIDGRLAAQTAAGTAFFDAERSRWIAARGPTPDPEAAAPPFDPDDAPRESPLAYATSPTHEAIGTASGLYARSRSDLRWKRLFPSHGDRSWAPRDVAALAFDTTHRLWFASPQGIGIGHLDVDQWLLFDKADGLPWNRFTAISIAPDGSAWLGTDMGLIRLSIAADGAPQWEVRQGRRWLPDDAVRDVLVDPAGTVWTATARGVGALSARTMTLAQKATRFEEQIDRYHRRTELGYVDGVVLEEPGDPETYRQRASDNDGLWTAMYGAGECFAYAATNDPLAAARARRAFEALRFLGTVTEQGRPAPPPGFVARTVLPTDGPDPNVGQAVRDREIRSRDRHWKALDPRWPQSADGRWYWKADTSSDELDGHYFFYALYYDLVADTSERARVRTVVARLTDHLVDHGFRLVDHDGAPTRWAVFAPEALNHDPSWWEERGLNSLSILAYLRIAEHTTGDPRYGDAARMLIERHAYAANAREPKVHSGPGTGNQSDDEMAFMNLYHLLRYERDETLESLWAHTFARYFERERPERNPLFHFLYAGVIEGLRYRDAFDDELYTVSSELLAEAADTLRRYPLDRFDWAYRNSRRLDVVLLPESDPHRPRGHLRDGRALPIDERFVNHWNHDPWRLDGGGEGRLMADPASFLLPYYLGLYHGFLSSPEDPRRGAGAVP